MCFEFYFSFIVVVKIQNFRLNQIPIQELNKTIPVIWEMTSGINVTIDVTFNGIPCCSEGPLTATTGECNCSVLNQDLFDPQDLVNISATAQNQIGQETFSLMVQVIVSLHLKIMLIHYN